ncbi:MAG: hypothetical protein HYT90_05645 [Candidatus Omnitrophica bacterium]|nr:hypothetical protein [Candidatus Omnitrophota bacterium]MBI2105037.1 hypothetical protein [Candidatus Omnitrophota bacterium]
MSEFLLPMAEDEWKKPAAEQPQAPSLMTRLALVEGEVLTYLEDRGTTTLRRLIRDLEWAAPLVMMGVGALIRAGLVRATQHDLEVLVEARRVATR